MCPWVKSHEIISFFEARTDIRWRMSIIEVCCDMSYTMENVLKELFPNASIVSDRFHVMKNILEDVWAIRTRCKTVIKKNICENQKQHEELLKKREKLLDKVSQWRWRPKSKLVINRFENWETALDIVTRIVWQIRQRKEHWNENQKHRRALAQSIPELKDLIEWYEYMYQLWKIYDEHGTVEFGKQKINQWLIDWFDIRSRIDEVGNFTKTIENRIETISNYFTSRHSNGFAEWLHSRIQRLISMSRWFINKDYMIYRIIKLCSS
jgi:transposase